MRITQDPLPFPSPERRCEAAGCTNTLKPHQKHFCSKHFCSKPCHGMSMRGSVKPGQEATEHPSTWDIAWAAGIYEGEGHCYLPGHTKTRLYYTARAQVTQRDRWLLNRFRVLFGGTIVKGNEDTLVWCSYGARACGFLMTIYQFLSPWRQEQVRYVLAGVPAAQIPPV